MNFDNKRYYILSSTSEEVIDTFYSFFFKSKVFKFSKLELEFEFKEKYRARAKRYILIYREFENEIIFINKKENEIVLVIIQTTKEF